jgi:hypothetical protein
VFLSAGRNSGSRRVIAHPDTYDIFGIVPGLALKSTALIAGVD